MDEIILKAQWSSKFVESWPSLAIDSDNCIGSSIILLPGHKSS